MRAEIEALAEPAARFAGRAGALRLLVVGGSLGAQRAERKRAAGDRAACRRRSGRASRTRPARPARDAVRAAYAAAGVDGRGRCRSSTTWRARLADCDVIVCRAGAITVSELCAAGVAARAGAARRQHDLAPARQRRLDGGARAPAIHLPQGELTPGRLADLLSGLTRDALLAMAARRARWRGRSAAARVADEIESDAWRPHEARRQAHSLRRHRRRRHERHRRDPAQPRLRDLGLRPVRERDDASALAALGVRVAIGHDAANIAGADAVVDVDARCGPTTPRSSRRARAAFRSCRAP